MKHRTLQKLVSLALACCLAGAAALPAFAAPLTAQPAGVMETLLEVPILGDLLRLFTGGEEEPSAQNDDESATAGRHATSESATPEAATPEAATPETAPAPGDWPAAWMVGGTVPGAVYPAGDPQAPRSLTVTAPMWSQVPTLAGSTVDVASREETNFGDLVADAVGWAVISSDSWQQNSTLSGLPLVSVVEGRSLLANVPAGTTLTAENLGSYLQDDALALVVVTPSQLHQLLARAMQDMLDPSSEAYGSYLQVSGLRFTWQATDGVLQPAAVWLAGLQGEQLLDSRDTTTRIALALPQALWEQAFPNTENLLSAADLTLHGALLDLAKHCDASTLAVLLGRGGSTGRALPVDAADFTACLTTDGTAPSSQAPREVDGQTMTATIDADGLMTIPGLTPGGHTVRLTPDSEPVYVSNLVDIGTEANAALRPTVILPEGFVTTPLPTPTPAEPAPTAAPAAPQPTPAAPTPTPAIVTVTGTAAPPAATPTPVPPASSAPVPTHAPATTRPSGGSGQVEDPLAGTIIGTTPAPTLTPTATPQPTPAPTPSPEEAAQAEQTAKTSARLPLYVGIAVLALGVVIVAVTLVRRRLEEGKGSHYHKH